MADSKVAAARAESIEMVRLNLPEVASLLAQYAALRIGASGADEKICAMLFKAGYAHTKQISPMKVGFHKMNRGGVLGHSMNVQRIMETSPLCGSRGKNATTHSALTKLKGIRPTKMLTVSGAMNLLWTSPLWGV